MASGGSQTTALSSTKEVLLEEAPKTVNDLIQSRIDDTPDAPMVGYLSSDRSAADYHFYTPRQLDGLANGAASWMLEDGLLPNTTAEDKVVALLAPSNLDYIVSIFALLRLRCSILFLSTRLSTEAYQSLLDKTGCNDLFYSTSTETAVQGIAEARPQTCIRRLPTRPQHHRTASPLAALPEIGDPSNRTAFIIHSSGSTGLPKPIFQTNAACIANYGTGNGFKAFLTLPLFHNHGLATFFRALCTGTPVALFNANLPLTTDNLLQAMECVKPQSFHGVPYALKVLSQSSRGIELLRQCKLVMFGGSSCPDDIGDKLVDAGVYLVAHYGATELGQLMTSFRPAEDKAWNYVRPFPAIAPYLHFTSRGEDLYECVVLDGLKSKVATNSDDPPKSFHTSDLFLKHPTIPNAWKYVSRNDDRINLMNGEKVLPIHYENCLRQDRLIKEALLFGAGKALPGLILIPSEEGQRLDDPSFLDAVWPTIKDANSRSEKFAQISREMVAVLPFDTPYPITDKGTLIRARSYKQFADLIESVYRKFEGDSFEGISSSQEIHLTEFLRNQFAERAGVNITNDDTDFFAAGIDSLQSITIRAAIKRHLRFKDEGLGPNVVFEYPTINKLAQHIQDLQQGKAPSGESEIQDMEDLIAKYSKFEAFTQRRPQYVLLTGATGSLGAHLLDQLLESTEVIRVYCLVRCANKATALERILQTLSEKGLSAIRNISRIIALPADLSQPRLGLSEDDMNDITSNLTKVIHSAWAVNFNLGVRSFEEQHIRGLHNLINLCLSIRSSKPAEMYFCSSVSAATGTPIPAMVKETPISQLEHAQSMGYARSKLVAEKLVQAAAEQTGIVAKVLRIGQIIGDSRQGIWNTTEAIPLMLQSAMTLGALPALDETPSWLPVDIVAKTVLDLSGLSPTRSPELDQLNADSEVVFQIQNPHLFHWTQDLLPALRSAGLSFEMVSQREWVHRLRHSDPDVQKNPTYKLLDFFARKYDHDGPGRSGLSFETEVTERASTSLREGFDVVGSGIVAKIVDDFQRRWGEQK